MDSGVILLAEDRDDDVLIIRKALRDAFLENPVKVVPDGEQAIAYLSGAGRFSNRLEYPLPVLLLLDLKMPRKDGFDVLSWLRAQKEFRTLPVIVLTSSQDLRDVKQAYQSGATSFLLKPIGLKEAREIADFIPAIPAAIDVLPSAQPAAHPDSVLPPPGNAA